MTKFPRDESTANSTLCRRNDNSCGACCWGIDVDRATLNVRLERHRKSFEQLVGQNKPTAVRLFWHECVCHRGKNLAWAVLLRIPFIRERCKRRLSRQLVCAFLGFDSAARTKVGCLLHPSRHPGSDIRNSVAFRMLPGVECGDPQYVCDGCHRFDAMSAGQKSVFTEAVSSQDWYDYTQTVRALSAGVILSGVDAGADHQRSPSGLLPIVEEQAPRASA